MYVSLVVLSKRSRANIFPVRLLDTVESYEGNSWFQNQGVGVFTAVFDGARIPPLYGLEYTRVYSRPASKRRVELCKKISNNSVIKLGNSGGGLSPAPETI